VVKPFVGVANDGPSDAAVLRPVLGSQRGVVIGCGMNPRYGDFDTYHMATSAIDEAVRNCVAVGADPARIALLDNFCWGDCERPETLGRLVRAALACHDMAVALGTPFISGKDSLNNEFSYIDDSGERRTIAIPPSLLISAMGQIDNVAKCVTMDLKEAGNVLYLVGATREEMGGSHFALLNDVQGGDAPAVDPVQARKVFTALHCAIRNGLVLACHDLSEGGLGVAAAEMAFGGGLGARIQLDAIESAGSLCDTAVLLFSESNTRFLCEVQPSRVEEFESAMQGVVISRIGSVEESGEFNVVHRGKQVIASHITALKKAWQATFKW
jgi:phosphoribosylformylglycinamidine synthase